MTDKLKDAADWEKLAREAVRTHGLEEKGFYNDLGNWVTNKEYEERWERDHGGAKKDDSTKTKMSLVPVEAIEAIASALAHGVAKYGKNNYKKGHKWSRCLDAALRHLYAMAHGEEIDQESGNTHLSHAMASLAMLSYHIEHHPDLNDLWETDNEQT